MALFAARKPSEVVRFPPVLKELTREEGEFRIWINNHRWNERMERWCRRQVERFTYRPKIGILMQCHDPREELLRESFSSIFNQVYPFHELSIVDRGSEKSIRSLLEDVRRDSRVTVSYQKGDQRDLEAIAKIMKKANAEWILLMGAEDVLEPNTLFNMVATLQDTVEIDFVFADSDLLDDQGLRFDPQFKPVWAVGASYPLGYYQHPVLLHDRLVKKLYGHERVSALMDEGSLLDEASNHSRYVLKAPGILYHGRAHGFKNEKPPQPVGNVLMNEELVATANKVFISSERRQKSEPNVPLRILWVIDSLQQGDGEMVLYHYLRYLNSESRHQFHVVATNDGPMRSIYEAICPVTVTSRDPNDLGETITKLHTHGAFDTALVSSVDNIWFPEVLQKLNLPALWHLHPGEATDSEIRRMFEYPATILFLHDDIAARYREFDMRRVTRTLPSGVDLAHIKLYRQKNSPFDLRARMGIAKGSLVVTSAGPTIPRKGQKALVTAAMRILDRNPEQRIDFFILGERPGPTLEELRRIVADSGRENQFHFVPEAADPFQSYPYFWISDVVVSCSSIETFPLSILEAMAFKKAVIGSNVSNTSAVIEHQENGFLYASPEELISQLETLIRDVDLREAFARRSLEIIYEKFQFRKIATRLEDLLRESIVYQ